MKAKETMDGSVTIVTACYNASAYLGETIESVLAQTYDNWEMIISDDCSTDGSPEIADGFHKKDGRIRIIRSDRNGGPAACRNRAIQAANGRYLAFLDSDDIWLPLKLEKQLSFMKEGRYALSFTAYRKIDEKGSLFGPVIDVPGKVDYHRMLYSNPIANLTAIYDTHIVGKVYQPKVGHEDYAQWLKILKMGYEGRGLNECLAYYRVGRSSISGNKLKAASFQWQVYRDVERLPLSKSLYLFLHYGWNGCRKAMKS